MPHAQLHAACPALFRRRIPTSCVTSGKGKFSCRTSTKTARGLCIVDVHEHRPAGIHLAKARQRLASCLSRANTSPLKPVVDKGLRHCPVLIPKHGQLRRPQHCRSNEGTLSWCFLCDFTSTLPDCCVYSNMHGVLPSQRWRRSESENWRSLPA